MSRIVVAGDALVDLIIRPDGSIAAAGGGGEYNASRAIGRQGGAVAFLGRISRDRFGRDLRAGLAQDGVDLGLVIETDDPTTLALAELDASGAASYRFYTAATSAPGLTAAEALRALDPLPAALHVGTLGLLLRPMADAIAGLVAATPPGLLVMVDPNIRPLVIDDPRAYRERLSRVLARADIVKASTEDLAWLAPGDDPVAAARALVADGAGVVLVTDGPGPVRAVGNGWERTIPTPSVRVADTVGAGDTFGGTFLLAWVTSGRGRSGLRDATAVTETTRRAAVAAAIACTRVGAEPPTREELEAALAAGR